MNENLDQKKHENHNKDDVQKEKNKEKKEKHDQPPKGKPGVSHAAQL